MSEGIRKVNEFLFQPGRTLITTDRLIDINNFENGTLHIDSNGNVKVKKLNNPSWANLTPGNLFTLKAITNAHIADKTITNVQIQDNTIENEKIREGTIKTNRLADNAVTESKILNSSVTNLKIKEGTIENSRLLNKTITNTKIADNTIVRNLILDGEIIESKIALNAVTENRIATNAVTENKIQADAIKEKHIFANSVTTGKIKDAAVTTSKILDGNITTGKIADLNVTSAKLDKNSVVADKILDGNITTSKLANLNVTTAKIADASITTSKILNSSITSEKLSSSLNESIYRAIKLESTGIAVVNGHLSVQNNITAGGTINAYKIYNAVYNDLAEGYVPGENLYPGEIVEIRDDGKVYKAGILSDSIVGVISEEYAECYGATEEEIKSGAKVAVGLIGKVHVNVFGPIKVGQRIVSIGDGVGAVTTTPKGIVGKALETSLGYGVKKVLCLIFPN